MSGYNLETNTPPSVVIHLDSRFASSYLQKVTDSSGDSRDLTTNYNSGDYIFMTRSDLEIIVNRDYTLTDITTEICLPNGKSADGVLGNASAIIYRIDFAERSQEEQEKLDEATALYFKKD